MSWTDERVQLLKQLWGEGKSAAEIARVLGDGVTRNAVIGKAHRLKLAGRVSPIQQNEKQEDDIFSPSPVVSRGQEKPVRGYRLADLRERMCRWPSGDPRDADFHFCGAQSVPGLPYCAEHARLAYQTGNRPRLLQAEEFEDKAAPEVDIDIKTEEAA